MMAEAQPSTSTATPTQVNPWANLPVDSRGKIGAKFHFDDDRKENESYDLALLCFMVHKKHVIFVNIFV